MHATDCPALDVWQPLIVLFPSEQVVLLTQGWFCKGPTVGCLGKGNFDGKEFLAKTGTTLPCEVAAFEVVLKEFS